MPPMVINDLIVPFVVSSVILVACSIPFYRNSARIWCSIVNCKTTVIRTLRVTVACTCAGTCKTLNASLRIGYSLSQLFHRRFLLSFVFFFLYTRAATAAGSLSIYLFYSVVAVAYSLNNISTFLHRAFLP